MEKYEAPASRFERIDGAMEKTMKACSYPSAACLLVMAVWATVNVIYSKITKASIPSTTDWITYLMIPAVYLSIAAEILDRGLVYVDIITDRMPKIVKKLILSLSYLAGAGITVVLMVLQCRLTVNYFQKGKVSSVDKLHFPIWPFTLIFAIGLGLMAVAMFWYAVRILLNKNPLSPMEEEGGEQV